MGWLAAYVARIIIVVAAIPVIAQAQNAVIIESVRWRRTTIIVLIVLWIVQKACFPK